MRTDLIVAIGIDEGGSLWVQPATATFPHIYREAMEVGWNSEGSRLFSPTPREWSYVAWFEQIRAAAREQGIELKLTDATSWFGVDSELQQAIGRPSKERP